MSGLNIPEEYKPGIKKIATVEDRVIEVILNALKELPPPLNIGALASTLALTVKDIEAEEIEDILSALGSLYPLLNYYDSVEDLADEINAAINTDDEIFKTIQDNERVNLIRRLTILLSVESVFSFIFKARELKSECERIYMSSRILTDIRPVFRTDIAKGLDGALIIHTLKIEYKDLDGSKEFFVALDSIDLQQLEDQVTRSLIKEEQLKSILNNANIHYIENEE